VFDRFNELAKRAVVAAQDAALSMGHDFIGTGHLLLGLTQTDGVAVKVLTTLDVNIDALRETVLNHMAPQAS
jgi:ATP-dependent Clp protease ATP-binding subunit ClpA